MPRVCSQVHTTINNVLDPTFILMCVCWCCASYSVWYHENAWCGTGDYLTSQHVTSPHHNSYYQFTSHAIWSRHVARFICIDTASYKSSDCYSCKGLYCNRFPAIGFGKCLKLNTHHLHGIDRVFVYASIVWANRALSRDILLCTSKTTDNKPAFASSIAARKIRWNPVLICASRIVAMGELSTHLCQHPHAAAYRHRLNGYLAYWVPSPPGKHTFRNFTIQAHPKTVCERKTRYPLGEVPV